MNEYMEIRKLAGMMNRDLIPYKIISVMGGYVMKYPEEKSCVCSIIEHDYSYGHDADRLEIMGLLTEEEKKDDPVYTTGRQRYNEKHCVKGWLTADDVFGRISADWNNRTKERYDGQRRVS